MTEEIQKSERGSVMAELAFVAPILAVLIIIVSDFGLFLQSYFRAMHVVREGIRTAVAVPLLESTAGEYIGVYKVTDAVNPVVAQTPAGLTPNHAAIQERIRKLLQVENNGSGRSLMLTDDEIEITTECASGKVNIILHGTYSPLFPIKAIWGSDVGIGYRAQAEGSYLFESCA